MKKGIFPLSLLLFFSSLIYSQSYPFWFLYPSKVGCSDYEVGYSATGYYRDSSKVVAFKNGCVNHARNASIKIEGGQGFWKTENGTYWMGAKINEIFDTASIQIYEKKLKLTYSYFNDEMTIAFLCNSRKKLSKIHNELLDINELSTPQWLNNIPCSENYIYAIGITPKYYYETSSWLEAEKSARINLAKQISVRIKSLQKSSRISQQEIRDEEFSVILKNISVAERWVDVDRKIFYVLMRMPL